MQKTTKMIVPILLAVLVVSLILAVNQNYKLKERVTSVKHELTLSQIQWDLDQLEGAIAYQIGSKWTQPSHVREKLGDVLQDIMVIRDLNSGAGFITNAESVLLNSLYDQLSNYPHDNMVEPINELSAEEIDKLLQLRGALRDVEWGIGFSNSGHWDSFIEKLEKLLPQL